MRHRQSNRVRGSRAQVACGLALALMLASGSVAGTARSQPWDVAPANPAGAVPPEYCPAGNGLIEAADALAVLRRGLGLITRFACNGVPIPDSMVDVSPTSIDATTNPPTLTAVGDGQISSADALVILRASVDLVQLVVGGALDLLFLGAITPELLVEASDADRVPFGNFPGPEDIDDGNGVIDVRTTLLTARVRATDAAGASSICAFDVDPQTNPTAIPLACENVAAFASAGQQLIGVTIPAPAKTGLVPIWLEIDSDAEVAESNENNNVQSIGLTVVPPLPSRPDLIFDSTRPFLLSPPTPAEGELVDVTARLRNDGNAPVADPFSVGLYLDLPGPPSASLCGFSFPVSAGIGVDELDPVEVTAANLALNSSAGPHALWGYVDSSSVCPRPVGGEILESLEGNNATPLPLAFCISSASQNSAGSIDLRADQLDINVAGNAFTIAGTYSNAGDKDVVQFVGNLIAPVAEIKIQVDAFGQNSVVLETDRSCIIHGTSEVIQFGQAFPVPADLPTTVQFRLDPVHLVTESNELNNDICLQVQPGGTVVSCP